MKARFCDECKHHVAEEAVFTDGQWTTCVLTCALGHKPRFFKPRHINDSRWGWKRACADFGRLEGASLTTFICPPQKLPAEKVRQIVRDAGCYWPEDDSFSSRMWRFNVRRIVNAAWHRGFADHAAAQRAGEEAVRKMFGGGECAT